MPGRRKKVTKRVPVPKRPPERDLEPSVSPEPPSEPPKVSAPPPPPRGPAPASIVERACSKAGGTLAELHEFEDRGSTVLVKLRGREVCVLARGEL